LGGILDEAVDENTHLEALGSHLGLEILISVTHIGDLTARSSSPRGALDPPKDGNKGMKEQG
jgi:hypothetical protein